MLNRSTDNVVLPTETIIITSDLLVAMTIEHVLHMAKGGGETSYAKNSWLQRRALLETTPLLDKAVREVYMALSHPTMTICDLGCSSSENTLFFVSKVIEAMCSHRRELGASTKFLDGLEGNPNEGNIYIAKNTPPYVVKLYQELFQKDFLLFLKLRYEELVFGGQMLLIFLGRKNEDAYSGELNLVYGLLAKSIQFLVEEGLVGKEKLDSFNLPIYGPSVDEVKMVVKQSELFDINKIELFEHNWDPYDYSKSDHVDDPLQSGMNVAKCLRAVMEPLFGRHFGESVLDALFDKYAHNVAEHLEREKTKYSIIVLSLKKG
ncbi:anthranilate O-methyltransferase 3-like isoform X3 [Lolium rigidum]|uniref:anthranilate O-methyltransferase 3-like isoform X3 n=1 Tax=Lolium rigidum TaxID=89674 RepID=UPI001F5C1EE9|nr:anthranilate O-methyltransferase 3-like isoform X3 [Lolium rigidum]